MKPSDIDSIVIHCSATREGQDVRASDIDRWHKERGFNQIGYHFVIDLDGTVENGRPLSMAGAHCADRGLSGKSYNLHSIGICYVGGLDKNGNPKGIGNFIRKTSLDEFPQFWNVLKGDMSLVGTRPPTVDEWEKYELHHRSRMSTKPGITGMWQVSGRSDITDFEEVVRLDTEYIQNWTIGLDIRILVKTVLAVVKHEGSV